MNLDHKGAWLSLCTGLLISLLAQAATAQTCLSVFSDQRETALGMRVSSDRSTKDLIPSPYLGLITAQRGNVPMPAMTGTEPSPTFAFDSVMSHQLSLRDHLLKLKDLASMGSPSEVIKEQLENTERTLFGLMGSVRHVGFVSDKLLLDHWFLEKAELKFKRVDGTVVAILSPIRFYSQTLDFKLPLIKSKGSRDPRNRDLFEDQYSWLLQSLTIVSEAAPQLQSTFDAINTPTATGPQINEAVFLMLRDLNRMQQRIRESEPEKLKQPRPRGGPNGSVTKT